MKKTIIDIVKIMVAAMVAMGVVCVLIAHDASDNICLVAYVVVAIVMTMVLGVFREPAKRKDMNFGSIRHRMGIGKGRSYGHAAIFVGAACVFIGSPEQCEDVCQDLWHHAQEAEVRMLDGSENIEVL